MCMYGSTCERRYLYICNPEVCQECRSIRELPSVSPPLTSNAALTAFLMHNYPHTHTPGALLFMRLPQSSPWLTPKAWFSGRLQSWINTQSSVRNCLQRRTAGQCRTASPEGSGLAPLSFTAARWIKIGPFWTTFKLLLISSLTCMTSFSCLKQFP